MIRAAARSTTVNPCDRRGLARRSREQPPPFSSDPPSRPSTLARRLRQRRRRRVPHPVECDALQARMKPFTIRLPKPLATMVVIDTMLPSLSTIDTWLAKAQGGRSKAHRSGGNTSPCSAHRSPGAPRGPCRVPPPPPSARRTRRRSGTIPDGGTPVPANPHALRSHGDLAPRRLERGVSTKHDAPVTRRVRCRRGRDLRCDLGQRRRLHESLCSRHRYGHVRVAVDHGDRPPAQALVLLARIGGRVLVQVRCCQLHELCLGVSLLVCHGDRIAQERNGQRDEDRSDDLAQGRQLLLADDGSLHRQFFHDHIAVTPNMNL